MTTTKATINLLPGEINFEVYGDGGTWTEEFTIPQLGDMTGATIVAKFRPARSQTSTALTVELTAPTESKFRITDMPRLRGAYDVEITLTGGVPRTYIVGDILPSKDRA